MVLDVMRFEPAPYLISDLCAATMASQWRLAGW
jgi:hypothetical protein